MIISRVLIKDYKQYVGEHDIAVPSSATVGVIGANGVGKTTLFQAIEWALYGAGAASAKDIRPRGRSGTTMVMVTLDVTSTGEQYIVERELKKSSTRAVIYRAEPDGEETIVVQGTTPVSDYVQNTLIGLDHKAFTATFFTRQKELGFFGDLGDSARRREVGKLLGLETIRIAQQKIGEDRIQARNAATVLEKQYETQSQGHDFPAEIKAAEATIQSSKQQLDAAHKDVDAATGKVSLLEKDLTAQQELKDKDGQFATRILELRGQSHAATQQRDTCTSDLARLDAREKERDALREKASGLETLQQRMRELDERRGVFQRRQQVQSAIQAHENRRRDAIRSLRSTVSGITPPSAVDGWAWRDEDDGNPTVACTRVITAIHSIRIDEVQQRHDALHALQNTAKDHDEAQATLKRYRDRRDQLEKELAAKLAEGDPAPELQEIDARAAELQQQEAGFSAELAQIGPQRERITRLARNLRQQDLNDVCPTCARPFSREDVEVTLSAFDAQLAQLATQEQQLTAKREALAREKTALTTRRTAVQERAQTIEKDRQGIANSVPYIQDQDSKCTALRQRLDDQLRALQRDNVPDSTELTRVSVEVQTWRRIIDTRSAIENRQQELQSLDGELEPLRKELAEIGDVSYDENEHRSVATAHQEAIKAASAVAEIERELVRRPQMEADLAAAKETIARLQAEIATQEKERSAVGFDPQKLATAADDLRKAREERDTAIELRHRVGNELTAAEHALTRLVEERERIAGLATQAEEQRHLHDRLDQMYREFDEFDRYAAAWYAPRLSEITSELVAEVTDGKYDRVVFDNNFGIDIFDGEDEKFPLDTFSGGERDAIALCARIALSRVIGGTGTQPPGFLVLDEVFGSLDLERRQRLLDMLGTITNSGEHFRQVFIISHVDDVRTSPIFDELWQIVENDEGTSELKALGHGSDIGEL